MSVKIRNKKTNEAVIDSENFFPLGLLLGLVYSLVSYSLLVIINFPLIQSLILIIIISYIINFVNNKYIFDFSLDDFIPLIGNIYLSICIGAILAYFFFVFLLYPFLLQPFYSMVFNAPGIYFDTSFYFIFYEILNNLYYSFQVLFIFLFITMYKLSRSKKRKNLNQNRPLNFKVLSLAIVIAVLSGILDIIIQVILMFLFNNQLRYFEFLLYLNASDILTLVKVLILVVVAFFLVEEYFIRITEENILKIFSLSYLTCTSFLLIFSVIFVSLFNQEYYFSNYFFDDFIWGFFLMALIYGIMLLFKYNPEITFTT